MTRSDVRLSAALALAGLTLLALAPAATARSGAPATGDGLTTCQRAISRIGAQMGHTLEKDAGGSDIYVFVVRSDSGDYSVRCDGSTGTLGAIDLCLKGTSSTCLAHSANGAASGK